LRLRFVATAAALALLSSVGGTDASGIPRNAGPALAFAHAYEDYIRATKRFFEAARVHDDFAARMHSLANTGKNFGVIGNRHPDDPFGPAMTETEFLVVIERMKERRRRIGEAMERLEKAADQAFDAACAAQRDHPRQPGAAIVSIVAATYGENCAGYKPHDGRANTVSRGNATAKVAAQCNGKRSCSFVIRWQELSDPAFGCMKDFKVEYHCGDRVIRRTGASPEAGHGKSVSMSCE
jgi:hypothetical protein